MPDTDWAPPPPPADQPQPPPLPPPLDAVYANSASDNPGPADNQGSPAGPGSAISADSDAARSSDGTPLDGGLATNPDASAPPQVATGDGGLVATAALPEPAGPQIDHAAGLPTSGDGHLASPPTSAADHTASAPDDRPGVAGLGSAHSGGSDTVSSHNQGSPNGELQEVRQQGDLTPPQAAVDISPSSPDGPHAAQAPEHLPDQQESPAGQGETADVREPLPPGDYRQDPDYIDNLSGRAYYDVYSNRLEVERRDGRWIDVDYSRLRSDLDESSPGNRDNSSGIHIVLADAYSRDSARIIHPVSYTAENVPNLNRIAAEIERQYPGAARELLGQWIEATSTASLAGLAGRAPAPELTNRQAADRMVTMLRNEGRAVVVNIGGSGAAHEPRFAISVNPNEVAARLHIPNHLNAAGEEIGSLFRPGSVDRVVGFGLPHDVLQWNLVAQGSMEALRAGGEVRIGLRWVHTGETAKMAQALRDAGFDRVRIVADAFVTAVKP